MNKQLSRVLPSSICDDLLEVTTGCISSMAVKAGETAQILRNFEKRGARSELRAPKNDCNRLDIDFFVEF